MDADGNLRHRRGAGAPHREPRYFERDPAEDEPLLTRDDENERQPVRAVAGVAPGGVLARVWSGVLYIWYLIPSWQEFRARLTRANAEVLTQPVSAEVLARMDGFRAHIGTQYDPTNDAHEAMLMLYWQLCSPGVVLSGRKSEQWKELGFQGVDPATDFRGSGFFGLCNLVYFAATYPDLFRSFLHERGGAYETYPFSVAGLNLTMLLHNLLGWGFKRVTLAPHVRRNLLSLVFGIEQEWAFDRAHPHDEGAGALRYVRTRADDMCAFEELYVMAFRVLNHEWHRQRATYMQFPMVMEATSRRLQELLGRVERLDDVRAFNRAANPFD